MINKVIKLKLQCFYTCLCRATYQRDLEASGDPEGQDPPPPPPEIKVTVAENSEQHSMISTYIHKLNLRVNISYNLRHALNTMFCLLSVSYLVGELFCCLHTTVMLLVCYINRQQGRG